MSDETELEALTREWREAAEQHLYWSKQALRHAWRAQRLAFLAAFAYFIAFLAILVKVVWL